jgi:mycothiol synthase
MGGFTQRALTEADAGAYLELAEAANTADGNDERFDEADYLDLLHHPLSVPGLDDFIGLFDDEGGRMAATAWVARRTEAGTAHWMHGEGAVHPDYRGRGLGTRLVRWQEALAPVVHERYFPGLPLELSAGSMEGNTGARELLANEGYTEVRWFFEMTRPEGIAVEEPRVPDGFELEVYSDAVREELRLASNEAFVDHWRTTAETREEWEHWVGRGRMRPDNSLLLRDRATGEIAGFLIAVHSEAEYQSTGVRNIDFDLIGTRRAYRRRGVASSLIAHALRIADAAGYRTASLGVDADNPSGALGLYERHGFRRRKAFVVSNKVLEA